MSNNEIIQVLPYIFFLKIIDIFNTSISVISVLELNSFMCKDYEHHCITGI